MTWKYKRNKLVQHKNGTWVTRFDDYVIKSFKSNIGITLVFTTRFSRRRKGTPIREKIILMRYDV